MIGLFIKEIIWAGGKVKYEDHAVGKTFITNLRQFEFSINNFNIQKDKIRI